MLALCTDKLRVSRWGQLWNEDNSSPLSFFCLICPFGFQSSKYLFVFDFRQICKKKQGIEFLQDWGPGLQIFNAGLFLSVFSCSKHHAIPAETSRSWSIEPLSSSSAPADNRTSSCCRYKGMGSVYKGPLNLSATCLHRLELIQHSLHQWSKTEIK